MKRTAWASVAVLAALLLARPVHAAEPRFSSAPQSVLELFAKTETEGRKLDKSRDYMMEIYRLPAGVKAQSVICAVKSRCAVKRKDGYGFYSRTLTNAELESELVRLNLHGVEQYRVFGYFDLTKDKYFALSFAKSGAVGGGFLIEDISFVVRPMKHSGGLLSFDAFAGFKYQMMGKRAAISPAGRLVKIGSQVSPERAFMIIGEADSGSAEPVYVAILRTCDKMHTPNFDVQMLEKGL